MKIAKILRSTLAAGLVYVLVVTSVPVPAHAESKDMIALQTQVQQLMDMVQRLQSTLDTRMGVMQHLVEQTADNANQMNATINALQLKINAQTEATGGKLDTVSGQVQSLNDSVDELKTRLARLDKSLADMQTQMQNIQTQPQTAPAGQTPGGPAGDQGAPQGGGTMAAAPSGPPVNAAPPLKDTYQSAVRDYNAAHYDVAASEFQDVLHFYPMDDLAGNAQFYLGEIAYRQLNFADAVKDYNAVLEGFPGSPKAPAAQLRKGLALLQLAKRDAGIRELRTLIQRHPQTPEAAQARTKLNSMGVRIIPTTAGR